MICNIKDNSIEDNLGHDTVVLNQIKILFLIFRFLLIDIRMCFFFSVERRKWFCDHCVGVVWRVISLIPLCESDEKNQDEQVTSRLNILARGDEALNLLMFGHPWKKTNYVHLNKKKVNLFSGNCRICFQHLTKWNWGYFLWFWFKTLSNNSITASPNN